MTHNMRCETAKGDLCRCSCNGDKHGITEAKKEETFEKDGWIYLAICKDCEAFDPRAYASGCMDMANSVTLRCEKDVNPQVNLEKFL